MKKKEDVMLEHLTIKPERQPGLSMNETMSMDLKPSILFIGKKHDYHARLAAEFIRDNFDEVEVIMAARDEHKPDDFGWWKGDYIISYLSPWIIPAGLLNRASMAAINFHPGPPEYPGIGCTNWAIYHGVTEYGVTCHHMLPGVDTGRIIKVIRFSVYESDTVESLTARCYAYMLPLFYDVMALVMRGLIYNNDEGCVHDENEEWSGRPYTRKQLDELCRITQDMSCPEVQRRVKATTYPGMPGAYIGVGGERFYAAAIWQTL